MSVGVVIPLYNHEKYIGDALGSVLAQALPADRIVIVDDGSTDRSVEMVRRFEDNRIHLITQENAGAHAALNRGIREAEECEFLAILNSDDVYHPDRLAKCVGYLREHPDCEVVVTGFRIIDAETQELPSSNAKVRRARSVWSARDAVASPAEWLGIANFAKTSSNFVVRSEYMVSHPFKDYRYTHDYFFAAVAAMHDQLAVVDDALLYYRVHGTNTIKSDSNDRVTRETVRLNLELLRKLRPSLAESPAVRANYARYLRRLAENFSDFRLEVFLAAVAGAVEEVPERVLVDLVDAMSAEAYPELAEPTGPALRELLAKRELRELESAVRASRWYSLGLALGRQPEVFRGDGPLTDSATKLAEARKALNHSKWLRLGRRLGVKPSYTSLLK